jgi:hypothetical protein
MDLPSLSRIVGPAGLPRLSFSHVVRSAVFAMVAAMLSLSQPVPASLLSVDLFAAGDGLLTRDTATGFEWLDLTATEGLSYNEFVAGAGGWASLGFVVARRTLVNDLYHHAGIGPGATPANGVAISEMVALMGCTFTFCSPELGSGASGLVDLDIFDPTTAVEMFMQTFHDFENSSSLLGGASLIESDVSGFLFHKDDASPFTGIYVYRLSEPATTTLLSLGVIALFLSILRRTAYSKIRSTGL